MRKQLSIMTLVLALGVPLTRADTHTVHGTVGMLVGDLITNKDEIVGNVEIWNTAEKFNIRINASQDRCVLSKYYIYLSDQEAPSPDLGYVDPEFGEWPYQDKFKKEIQSSFLLELNLAEDLPFLVYGQWGEPWLQQRLVTVAVRVEMKTTDAVPVTFEAWAINPNFEFVPLESQLTAWGTNPRAFRYELQHPMQGNFVGPVHGLTYATPTHSGVTGEPGGFSFYPGEDITFWIGDAYIGTGKADQRVSPLDLMPGADIADGPVINMARLLLSLDADGNPNGVIDIANPDLGVSAIDFGNTAAVDALMPVYVSAEAGLDWLEGAIGNSLFRRNVSKTPDYTVDKPKLDIIPVWVPARTASGLATTVEYKDDAGTVIETRSMVKPLVLTYTEQQEPNTSKGIFRRGSDIITAVSMDDGATWKRFNVSHMANMSSFTLDSGEKFPGDSRGPVQKIVDDKILVVWTSAYARGGKPSFSIKTDDDYPYDDAYAVDDIWGVRGRQGSVDYDEDKDVGDQGIGEIPYYAVWSCRGVLIYAGNAAKYPNNAIGDIIWFKPERLTSGRRDAFFVNMGGAKGAGFAVAWQEDPGGLLPGTLKGGGDGWSGATVHKKTDIWYSYISLADFATIDPNFVPGNPSSMDEFADQLDEHGMQPEISNRPKWMVPMSLPVRVSDNNTVNTDNLRVQLDPETGLPMPGYVPIEGALEEDFLASEHETDGDCENPDDEHSGNNGTGGGWGMARYAYLLPELGVVDLTASSTDVWEGDLEGDYIPYSGNRWYRFTNKAGLIKTIAVTADGRPLDGDTGAARPFLQVMSGGWAILGYEETKGLGIPPEGDHEDAEVDRVEPDDSGKNVIYHSFKFNQPDLVSAGNVLNLPALDDYGTLIPIYYKDAAGLSTGIFRQYKTENARRLRVIAQSKGSMGASRTIMLTMYKQGREGSGKPSDIFAIRGVVPTTDKSSDNPYRFSNLQRYATGSQTSDPNVMMYQRRHQNMTSATVEVMDPVLTAGDDEGNSWNKVGKWKQYQGDLSDESFSNPYSDAKGHRGFIRGDTVVIAYSFTPNWGRLGGDHMDFYVRRSFNGGQTWTTDPNGPDVTTHTVIERDPFTGEFTEKQYQYGRGEFEPGRNVSLLKGNSHTVTDPRLVPPMGQGSTVNPMFPEDDAEAEGTYVVAFGTAEVLHGLGEPLGVSDIIKKDLFYTRTTDGGSTWLQVPWVINPDSASPDAGETIYRFPWLAQGTPHQGHAQIRMHPSGTRLYAIWHQWTDGDDEHVSPNEEGDDIWFRRIDFMQ